MATSTWRSDDAPLALGRGDYTITPENDVLVGTLGLVFPLA